MFSLKKELAEIEADKRNLTAENEKLKEYMYLLRNNKRFIENIAREELGLVRNGEIVYFFKKQLSFPRNISACYIYFIIRMK